MPETIAVQTNARSSAELSSNREDADNAIAGFRNLGVPDQNIQVVVQLDEKEAEKAQKAYTETLVGRGFAESQAAYYDKAIREGKTLVAVHNVTDAKPIIDVFDKFGSDFNPTGRATYVRTYSA